MAQRVVDRLRGHLVSDRPAMATPGEHWISLSRHFLGEIITGLPPAVWQQ
jgi:hypothetical protein